MIETSDELNKIFTNTKTTEVIIGELVEYDSYKKLIIKRDKVWEELERYSPKESLLGLNSFIDLFNISAFDDSKPILILNNKLIAGRHRLLGYSYSRIIHEFGYTFTDMSSDEINKFLKEISVPAKVNTSEITKRALVEFIAKEDFDKTQTTTYKALCACNAVNDELYTQVEAGKRFKVSERTIRDVKYLLNSDNYKYLLNDLKYNIPVELPEYFKDPNTGKLGYRKITTNSVQKVVKILRNNEDPRLETKDMTKDECLKKYSKLQKDYNEANNRLQELENEMKYIKSIIGKDKDTNQKKSGE